MLATNIESHPPLLEDLLDFVRSNSTEFKTEIKEKWILIHEDYLIITENWVWYYIDTSKIENLNGDLLEELESNFQGIMKDITSTKIKFKTFLIRFWYNIILPLKTKQILTQEIEELLWKQEADNIGKETRNNVMKIT